MRTYQLLPRIPDAGLLDRYLDAIGVIVPIARTNEVLNPSGETNTTGYTAGSGALTRSTEQQYHGAYSFKYVPAVGVNDGFYYGTISMTAGQTRAISCKWYGAAGVAYKFSVATTGGADLATYRFIGTGRWQWIWLYWTETSTTTRRIYFTKDNNASVAAFYVDGVQSEVINAGETVSTYIDGDQMGLVANQRPPAYLWTGTPHASSSTRSGQTRAGGRVVRFRDLGFLLTTIIGLGMAPPEHQALTFAQLDGGQYQNTLKPPRSFTLIGRVASTTPNGADTGLSQLGRLLDRDLVVQRQPLVLTTQAQECGADCGDRVFVQALYSGGLEGQTSELPTYQVPITFTQYLPYITGGNQGAALDVQDVIASPNAILHRSPSGVWDGLGTGVTGGTQTVYAFVQGLDGLIYIGGNFTDAGGSGADYFAAYNPATGTYSAPGGAGALNGPVRALAVAPNGNIYVGGQFTNAGSIPGADGIAVWNPNTTTWSNLSTGTAGTVYALAVSPAGILFAGGSFTSIGGSTADNVAQWSGSAWSNLTSDTAIGAQVNALVWGNNRLYVGGNFTNASGVADADYIASWTSTGGWAALSTGMNNTVNALAVALNGAVYAGGTFTTAGGIAALRIAQWNGQQWAPLGAGLDNAVSGLAVAADGTLYVVGLFTTTNTIPLTNVLALWNNGSWKPGGVELSVNLGVYAVYVAPGGDLYIGFVAGGSATAGSVATVLNSGTADAIPRVIIRGPTSGTSRIYELSNSTIGARIYFNYAVNAGETLVFSLDPKNITFTSSFRGNILNAILPGSESTLFNLQPGANAISFLSISPSVTAVMQWPIGYNRLSDALYEAVAP